MADMLNPSVLSGPGTGNPKLLDQMRDVIRRKHYSIRTEQTYCDWVRRFILFHSQPEQTATAQSRWRHPREMGEREIAQFLTALATDGKVAASTQNQALSALLFLYKEVLNQEVGWLDGVERARKPVRLPVVLTREEVGSVLNRMHGTHRMMAEMLYGSGLRLMECVRLRVHPMR